MAWVLLTLCVSDSSSTNAYRRKGKVGSMKYLVQTYNFTQKEFLERLGILQTGAVINVCAGDDGTDAPDPMRISFEVKTEVD